MIAREPSALVSWFLGWVPKKERKLGMIYRRGGSRSHDRMTDRLLVERIIMERLERDMPMDSIRQS